MGKGDKFNPYKRGGKWCTKRPRTFFCCTPPPGSALFKPCFWAWSLALVGRRICNTEGVMPPSRRC